MAFVPGWETMPRTITEPVKPFENVSRKLALNVHLCALLNMLVKVFFYSCNQQPPCLLLDGVQEGVAMGNVVAEIFVVSQEGCNLQSMMAALAKMLHSLRAGMLKIQAA